MLFKILAVAAAITGAFAQRPSNTSICDYYTTALLKNNTAANQEKLITFIVNTAVIGNYTTPNIGISVPGILTAGTYNGTRVNLLPYFNGALASTNRGGVGRSVNFLDGGGAAPLVQNKPANSTSSNQYILLTHLYEYFGALFGCSGVGTADYPVYNGLGSQYQVHKFMGLSHAQVGYFIEQVALSAASFGVGQSDLMIVGNALNNLFNYRCAPPTVVIPIQGAQFQSICLDNTCPISRNSTCFSYDSTTKPAPANSTNMFTPNATTTKTGSKTSSLATATVSPPPKASHGGAVSVGMSFAVVAGGLAALFL
ncbi:hypothetical protein G7Y89_g4618 [Cudoniella acicularis]|uniref:Uncharacterized protein n=1 Tax=Cudoniella acicularis TaxID=354080 RepID=A0A8H4RP32_9HELO|nr:hypothetical protein G7Y89_g4618 [Cudoniella acicularis]